MRTCDWTILFCILCQICLLLWKLNNMRPLFWDRSSFLHFSLLRLPWQWWHLLVVCGLFIHPGHIWSDSALFTFASTNINKCVHLFSITCLNIASSSFYYAHSVKWILVSFDQTAVSVVLRSFCRLHAHHTLMKVDLSPWTWTELQMTVSFCCIKEGQDSLLS